MKQNFNKNPLELYHADTQEWYIDNPDVICHVGKKGMKWGFIDGIATGGRKAIGKLTATGEYVYDNAKKIPGKISRFSSGVSSGITGSKYKRVYDNNYDNLYAYNKYINSKNKVKMTGGIADDIGYAIGSMGEKAGYIGKNTIKTGLKNTKKIGGKIKRLGNGIITGLKDDKFSNNQPGKADDVGYKIGNTLKKFGGNIKKGSKLARKKIDDFRSGYTAGKSNFSVLESIPVKLSKTKADDVGYKIGNTLKKFGRNIKKTIKKRR